MPDELINQFNEHKSFSQWINYLAVDIAEHLKNLPTESDITYVEQIIQNLVNDKISVEKTLSLND